MSKFALRGLQHIGIPTNDMDATIQFYTSLGFNVVYQTMNQNEKVTFMELDHLAIEAYENGSAVMKGGAVDHIALDSEDIEQTYKEVKALNFSGITEIEFLPFYEHGVRFFKVVGPNHEVIEFCERLR